MTVWLSGLICALVYSLLPSQSSSLTMRILKQGFSGMPWTDLEADSHNKAFKFTPENQDLGFDFYLEYLVKPDVFICTSLDLCFPV